jgi:hypothetical protein
MKRRLQRVLRVRKMLEDLAQTQFDRKAGEARQLEAAAGLRGTASRAVRTEAVASLCEPAGQDKAAWLTGLADAEILAWTADRLSGLAKARAPEVEAARRQLAASRLDRRQLETLAAAAARTEEREAIRKEQNGVDDWFQSRSARESLQPD